MHIKVKKGLDIPITGKPEGKVEHFSKKPPFISLNLSGFEDLRVKLLKKEGDKVTSGEPICEDKSTPGRMFVSPAAGVIVDITRGMKRRILNIIIQVDEKEEHFEYPKDLLSLNKEELIQMMLTAGLFTKIYQRPFGLLANPKVTPRAIFVKAIESAPFTPPAELQVEGREIEFQTGLDALAKLTKGKVHLVYHQNSNEKCFKEAKNVVHHTAEGPHPVGTHSVHIQNIDPIKSIEDTVWTVNVLDVIAIGYFLLNSQYYNEKVISIAGCNLVDGKRGYFKIREGFPISLLVEGRLPKESQRLISGDPLMGHRVDVEDFIGFDDTVFCVIPENEEREFLHFFRLGTDKYTFSRAYASGHLKNQSYPFTTNQHGEHRYFIEPRLYDQVMPLNVSTMLLVKSIMANDFDLAEELGLLEVHAEDFALPTFVCPSKMEMTEIVKEGLKSYAVEVLG